MCSPLERSELVPVHMPWAAHSNALRLLQKALSTPKSKPNERGDIQTKDAEAVRSVLLRHACNLWLSAGPNEKGALSSSSPCVLSSSLRVYCGFPLLVDSALSFSLSWNRTPNGHGANDGVAPTVLSMSVPRGVQRLGLRCREARPEKFYLTW